MKKQVKNSFNTFFAATIFFLMISGTVQAATIFQTTGFITGIEGYTFTFSSGQEADTYQATLSDLSLEPLGFDLLWLSISTPTETLGTVTGSGNFFFDVLPDSVYFANVFGVGSGSYETGLYGIEVTNAPIPAAIWILGSGLAAMILMRRRQR